MYSFLIEWVDAANLSLATSIPLLVFIRFIYNKFTKKNTITITQPKGKRLSHRNILIPSEIIGLPNLGNTCYMNAVMNVLIRLPLNIYFDLPFLKESHTNSLIHPYMKMVKTVNNIDECNLHRTLTYIKQILANDFSCYRYSTQEDSMEFYLNFIHLITKEYYDLKDLPNVRIEHNIHRDIREQVTIVM